MADHSHAPVEQRDRPARRLRATSPSSRRGRAPTRTPRSRVCPAQRSAMVYVLLRGGPRRARAAARRDGARRLEGVDLVDVAPTAARARSPARAASCASRRAATCATRAAGAGASTATLERPRRAASRTACSRSRAYPDALARVWSALTLPDRRRRPALARRPGASSPTGAASTTSAAAATARCTAVDSLGALAFCGIDGAARPRAVVASPTSRRWSRAHFGVADAATLAARWPRAAARIAAAARGRRARA